jgi:transglutaminase-like putative cysteine protease
VSRLYYSESGRVIRGLSEELTRRRRARKILRIPDNLRAGGTLYVYAHAHPGHTGPLRVAVNGNAFEVSPADVQSFRWFELPLQARHLRAGENVIEMWSDTDAMDGWVLGLEGRPDAADSALSLDGGATWSSDRMGLFLRMRGEYVVRLRLHDAALSDPPPPAFAWERPDCPALEPLLLQIPAEVRRIADPWARARALSSWVSGQWLYRNTTTGAEYAPWDPLTILSWGRAERGQELERPIVMCVHFGVVYVAAALAVGLPARNLCTSNTMDGMLGHFISEVWIEKWGKWCQVDANCDIVYLRDGVPLSVAEMHPAGADLARLAVKGPGFPAQPEFIRHYADEHLLSGRSFAVWAVWPRNDYMSRPDCTATMHGAGSYHEAEWLWAASDPRAADAEMGMFPHRLPPERLHEAPPAAWRSARPAR